MFALLLFEPTIRQRPSNFFSKSIGLLFLQETNTASKSSNERLIKLFTYYFYFSLFLGKTVTICSLSTIKVQKPQIPKPEPRKARTWE